MFPLSLSLPAGLGSGRLNFVEWSISSLLLSIIIRRVPKKFTFHLYINKRLMSDDLIARIDRRIDRKGYMFDLQEKIQFLILFCSF